MKFKELGIPDVKLIQPDVFGDQRGYFLETFRSSRYENIGIDQAFVQDNLSFSRYGVLRGLHFQCPHGQGKLVQVLQGRIFDVAVDVRSDSPTFGKWVGEYLSGTDHAQLWVPAGFAHGFCVLSDTALFSYKCTDVYTPSSERAVRWDDPAIGVQWPIKPIEISSKDDAAPMLNDIPLHQLPRKESIDER